MGIILLAASVLAPTFGALSPAKAFVVATGSMEPEIPVGSMVVAAPGEVEEGDVIVFWSPTGAYQVHRVVEVQQRPEGPAYRTQGDANPSADAFVVPAQDVVGKVKRTIPVVGHLWLLPSWVTPLVFFGALLVYLGITGWDARPVLRRRRTKFAAVGLAVLAAVPGSFATVVPAWPSSADELDPLTPSIVPLGAGTMGSSSIGADLNSATATVGQPTLWKEVVLWACAPTGGCTHTPPGLTYQTVAGSLTLLDMSAYTPAPELYLEAYMAAPVGQTARVRLFDATGGAAVSGSEVSTSSTSPVLVRAGPFTVSGTNEYQFQSMNTGAVSGGAVHSVKVLIAHSFPTTTETQVHLSGADRETQNAFSVPARATRWLYEPTSMDGLTAAYLEVVGEIGTSTGRGRVQLMEVTSASAVTSFDITSTTPSRVRSTDILGSLVGGNEYELEFRPQGGPLPQFDLHLARIVLVQNDFTTTVRYVELAHTTTSTSASFVDVAYDGHVLSDTEWGDNVASFEATLASSSGAQTASARAFDRTAGLALAGSQIDTTSTTRTRLRSGTFDLNGHDGDYAAQVSTTGGTLTLRGARLVMVQSLPKTFDSVLVSDNDSSPACTWSFHLEHVTATNLARIDSAIIRLTGDSGTEDQIVISSGSTTQTAGTAVTVAGGSSAEHAVLTEPNSVGTTTIEAELVGRCVGTGIATVQAITYELG